MLYETQFDIHQEFPSLISFRHRGIEFDSTNWTKNLEFNKMASADDTKPTEAREEGDGEVRLSSNTLQALLIR